MVMRVSRFLIVMLRVVAVFRQPDNHLEQNSWLTLFEALNENPRKNEINLIIFRSI
jgi:hypothetical protein